jgi:hypothetical protein
VAGRIRQAVMPTPAESDVIRIGWVERVSLPELGLWGLAAKVDTGARTSALHVRLAEPIRNGLENGLQYGLENGLDDGLDEGFDAPTDRSLFIVLPPLGGSGDRRLQRVVVKDWIEVRDTSGRCERRPVVETTLEMGPLRRTIRLTLTDRGDMRYEMLVGRTAIPPGVLVDPAARFLLNRPEPIASGRRSARRSQPKI